VFNHFRSKHALVEAITEDVFAYYRAMLEMALADEASPTPALVRALFEQMGMGIEAYHGFFRGVFREIARIQVGLDEGVAGERVRGQALHLLEKLMVRGLERGELRGEHTAEDLAAAFDALSNGTISHWLYEDRAGSLRARMRRAAEIFLGPVESEPAATRDTELPSLLPPDRPVPNRGLPPEEPQP
jgi:AcrR family transcriptional regulator